MFESTLPSLAARCLQAGEQIFDLADTHPHGHLLTAIPYGFYPESEWRDDLRAGRQRAGRGAVLRHAAAAALAHTSSLHYLRLAASWAKAYIARNGAHGESLNLYDVQRARPLRARPGAAPGAPAGRPGGLQAQLIANLREQLSTAVAQSQRDPFGFGVPWASSDTASRGDGLAVMASEYDELTGEASYRAYAARWLANVLGANAWGSSFIIGDGAVFPDCPQHQVANLVGSLDGTPPVLAGAVVEGAGEEASRGKLSGMRPCPHPGGDPYRRFDNAAVYEDNVQSYTNTEPAIDLTASSMLAFSWQVQAPAELPRAMPAPRGSPTWEPPRRRPR